MFIRKSKKIREKFRAYKEGRNDDGTYRIERLEYVAKIICPSAGILKLKAEVLFDITSPSYTKINLLLYRPDTSIPHQAVISTFYYDTEELYLEIIETPEDLRRMGLGTEIFKALLKVIYRFCKEFEKNIYRIYGRISGNEKFTPDASIPFYNTFNNYAYSEQEHKYLKLNMEELINYNLEYTIINN